MGKKRVKKIVITNTFAKIDKSERLEKNEKKRRPNSGKK